MYDRYTPAQPAGLMDFVKAAKSRIRELSPAGLDRMREARSRLLVVDVREASEHEQGHIEGALLVPRGILEAAADPSYPKRHEILACARSRPIVTYCATGGRSAMAAAVLEMMGFEEVYSLSGGIGAWQEAGLPVVHEARYV
ncbi:MAG: rhodanese-like domain-containing protein [Gammaproteobacteria bacterium]|nr:rhodanese-like domain-containing protein [Gammaproteobacteria bacterium]NIR83850.1 rhodanese-like domain-containing protein [Gammaproteobacteria bacterium]NIU04150.1 rhodanese-like domain-containing protein [Gammaproteobacteria bacterium]NIX85424.1 rhodanese-like domain-containing protein [Gammaproteobacteria bacterium]